MQAIRAKKYRCPSTPVCGMITPTPKAHAPVFCSFSKAIALGTALKRRACSLHNVICCVELLLFVCCCSAPLLWQATALVAVMQRAPATAFAG